MICRLCNKNKALINAHLLPKWAFMYLYPKKETKRKSLIIIGKGKEKNSPTGLYDPNILCKNCDAFLGRYDEYGKQIILDAPIMVYDKSKIAYVIENIDEISLNIFFLSVLWRMGISSREEVRHVSLGPFQEKIWKILNDLKNGKNISFELDQFSIFVSKFSDGDYPDLVDKNIQMPIMSRIADINCVFLYFPRGLKVVIKTDKREFLIDIKKLNPEKGKLLIIALNPFQESEEFKQMKDIIIGNRLQSIRGKS